MNKVELSKDEYIHIQKGGKEITVCTMRQKALHTIGLNSGHTSGRLYTRHGKRYYKPFRNYFGGKDKDLDILASAGYMNCEDEFYSFNRKGLDWLGEQIGIYIYDEER